MDQYHIDHIVWHELHERMDVTYIGREPDHVVADKVIAASLAQDAGLVLVPTPPGMVRWVRDPDLWLLRARETA